MEFRIELTPEAVADLKSYRKTDRKRIFNEIEKQLKYQPAEETRNRKKLRPNEIAEWELRVDRFRVFYDIDVGKKTVKIEAVGSKSGSTLFIHGEKYKL